MGDTLQRGERKAGRMEEEWGKDSEGSSGDNSCASTSIDNKSFEGGGIGHNDRGRGGRWGLATGDAALQEMWRMHGKGKEEGGTGSSGRQQIRRGAWNRRRRGVEDPLPLQQNRALSELEGGRPSPWRKAWTCRSSPLRGRNRRFRRYM